eukprot:2149370-Rhodomonas_salina.2
MTSLWNIFQTSLQPKSTHPHSNMQAEESTSDAGDTPPALEVPAYARFLSLLCLSQTQMVGTEWIYNTGSAMWGDYKQFCKRNNYRNKLNASQFASALTDLSVPENNGLRKYHSEGRVMFAYQPDLMKKSLQEQNMFDEDVW